MDVGCDGQVWIMRCACVKCSCEAKARAQMQTDSQREQLNARRKMINVCLLGCDERWWEECAMCPASKYTMTAVIASSIAITPLHTRWLAMATDPTVRH